MTSTVVPRLLAASAALAIAIGLAGCSAGDPGETAAPEPSPASTPSAEPVTETPTEDPATSAATCDDLMTPEAYAQLESDGLVPMEFDTADPIARRIAEQDGLACNWGKPQSDILLHVRQAEVGADEAGWTDALTSAGYRRTDDPVTGAWTGPVEPGSGLSPVVVVADGTVTFVSAPTFAQWIRPAS
ncbi:MULTISPECIES: hypothetical protein [unclassified Agromyces]|uniref:hypothetical protein n=1 Tax=unclassified Agromyces TaxID=2639701 RepID=UPI0030154FAE